MSQEKIKRFCIKQSIKKYFKIQCIQDLPTSHLPTKSYTTTNHGKLSIFSSLLDAKVPNVTSTVLRYNPLWHHRSGIWKFIPWVMFNAYEGKHMTNIHVSLSLNMTFWIKHIQCNSAYQLQYTLNFIDLTE